MAGDVAAVGLERAGWNFPSANLLLRSYFAPTFIFGSFFFLKFALRQRKRGGNAVTNGDMSS